MVLSFILGYARFLCASLMIHACLVILQCLAAIGFLLVRCERAIILINKESLDYSCIKNTFQYLVPSENDRALWALPILALLLFGRRLRAIQDSRDLDTLFRFPSRLYFLLDQQFIPQGVASGLEG